MPHNDDDKIWSAYAKRVKRMPKLAPKRVPLPRREGLGVGQDVRHPKTTSLVKAKLYHSVTPAKKQEIFDRKTERAWREGDIAIEARIDLHGLTQAEAHDALARFLEWQMKAGNRNLLIITGKGVGKKGVLRSSLAGWLEAMPVAKKIITLRPASLKHGGDGAFYLILKRDK